MDRGAKDSVEDPSATIGPSWGDAERILELARLRRDHAEPEAARAAELERQLSHLFSADQRRAAGDVPAKRVLQLLLPDPEREQQRERLRQAAIHTAGARLAILVVDQAGESVSASPSLEPILAQTDFDAERLAQWVHGEQAGARLILPRSSGGWLQAIRAEALGYALALLSEVAPGGEEAFSAAIGEYRLGPRQAKVAELACDGLSNSEVAYRLSLSPETVKRHLAVVYQKVGVSSRPELVKRLFGIEA